MNQTQERPTVLCIDDTDHVRLLIRRLLSHRYEIVEAEEALRGIEVARQIQPDLILVDLHMPNLTGYEVATRLKSFMPRVPIIALTADTTMDVRERALTAGCDGYMSKPIDPDKFEEQVASYLAGEREKFEDASYRKAYQQTLVARLEEKVQQNDQLLEKANRQAKLLKIGAKVAQAFTSILDLDTLLNTAVDLICNEFGFYYAGVFLVDEDGQWAVLRAGRGEAGEAMLAEGHRLKVDGLSMIGTATGRGEARIALDVGEEPVHFDNPHLPETRSEMALPLITNNEVIGAVTVQSTKEAAFSEDDITALQTMADQLAIAVRNARLYEQNQALLRRAERHARMLEAAAEVGHDVTSILDLQELLNKAVDIICDEYGFYYSGVFLINETGEWAELRAGRGKAGEAMINENHRLKVGGHSMIGASTEQRKARIALDVGEAPVHFKNPHLPHTRSEMALPLAVRDEVIGALTVQSTKPAAFSEDDITSLQTMADQLAVAIDNARAIKELEKAHEDLARTRTFEAIAATTGEAIHWVGNKAAPITGSVERITEDLTRYFAMVDAVLEESPPRLKDKKFGQMLSRATQDLSQQGIDLKAIQADLERQPLKLLSRILNVNSILEDLKIIESSGQAILNIKEDLIGPARQTQREPIHLPDLLEESVASMGIPDEIAHTLFAPDLPPVRGNKMQLDRVFTNLIKNAMEAMEDTEQKKLLLWARPSDGTGKVAVDVTDNGSGIPPDQIDKIWMPFYTTKGEHGGTGLGLPACAQVVEQMGGNILVDSEVGEGTTFTVILPTIQS